MAYDESKTVEVVLALHGAFEFKNGAVWKRIDFAIMNRLHDKGCVTNPAANRSRSV